MRLLIVSHTAHYTRGTLAVGWGPTVREIDALSTLFEEVVHIAPMHPGSAPESSLAYRSSRVRLRPVPPAGGTGVLAKIGVILQSPIYLKAVLEELRRVDAVHIRCPANISLLSILVLTFVNHPRVRWVKYAGNWNPDRSEAWSYTLQRWWLRRGLHRGSVTVNGEWPSQPTHVFSFLNPCLTDEELRIGRLAAEQKNLAGRIRLLYVGRLDKEKGCGRALQTLALLRKKGLDVHLDLVGDGPEWEALQRSTTALGLSDAAVFHGWKSREALGEFYAKAHFLILPSESSEGWPKVLSEAMAYGAVPIAGAISSIPQVLRRAGLGQSLAPGDVEAFARAVQYYLADRERWSLESRAATRIASDFTYSSFLHSVMRLFWVEWGFDLSVIA